MNKTAIFLAVAGVLALLALAGAVPRVRGTHTTPIEVPRPPTDPTLAHDGSLTMRTRLSHPFVRQGRNEVFLTVELTGQELAHATRAPVNLALVIDRSGSMSGFKLTQAKEAARQLVSQLRPEDRLAIVHYGSDVKSMDGVQCTEDNKTKLLSYIDGIWDDGGTNIGQGLTVGRDLLLASKSEFRVNRLILISDGQPTEGLTDFAGLGDIVRQTRAHGISVSSIGVGDDFNESLMESFSELGGGAYAYLQDASQLSGIFQRDLNAAATQVARAVTVTLNVPPSTQLQEVLGYSNVTRSTQANGEVVRIPMPDFASGQNERVVIRLAVDGNTIGQPVDVSAIALDYLDLVKNDQVRSLSSLTAMVTDSADVVANNRDKDAIIFAARARSATNLRQAAEELRHGNRVQAQKLMQDNVLYFEEAAAVGGKDSVAGDLDEQAQMRQQLDSANDEGAVNTFSKSSRKKARVDFGLMGSTY